MYRRLILNSVNDVSTPLDIHMQRCWPWTFSPAQQKKEKKERKKSGMTETIAQIDETVEWATTSGAQVEHQRRSNCVCERVDETFCVLIAFIWPWNARIQTTSHHLLRLVVRLLFTRGDNRQTNCQFEEGDQTVMTDGDCSGCCCCSVLPSCSDGILTGTKRRRGWKDVSISTACRL